jgi:hypothetical protein
MRNIISSLILCIIISASLSAQQNDDLSGTSEWSFNPELYFYFIPDDFYLLPIMKADRGVLHLEARFNYEGRNTLSVWGGYNIYIEGDLELTVIPMAAVVLGETKGLAPGLEFDLIYNNFELYTESEYLFNTDDGSLNYFYNWGELSYSPVDWIWFGLVGQSTIAYQTEPELEQGILLGAGFYDIELTGYLFSINEDPWFVLSAAVTF